MNDGVPSYLLVEVHLHGDRFHGRSEWPPSPARLFQALVAGAARPALSPEHRTALDWLENLPAPVIACPDSVLGQQFDSYVPNNNLDFVDGDPAHIGDLRIKKVIEPRLLSSSPSFLYGWRLEGAKSEYLVALQEMAELVYQFGRGVDMAWAQAHVVDEKTLERALEHYRGRVHVPVPSSDGNHLRVPTLGTLHSLEARHAAQSQRFQVTGHGKARQRTFSQPPRPHFVEASYDCQPSELLYELRAVDDPQTFVPWPQKRCSLLVEQLRNAVAGRLIHALPHMKAEVEHVLVGRRADGSNGYPAALRVQIVPLPSVGHAYAGGGIRRVLIVVPPGGLLPVGDLRWAFSGLEANGPSAGSPRIVLIPAAWNDAMLRWYGLGRHSGRVWRSATPAALPEAAARRRIDPGNRLAEAKPGSERVLEEERACESVRQALRHAGVRTAPLKIRVQREPFGGRGERAEPFAEGTRFAKERLWHVEVEFAQRLQGPLVLGDGRFLGLGVMSTVRRQAPALAFFIRDGLVSDDASVLANSLRRAVMARVQRHLGPRQELPEFISGHSKDGAPSKEHNHLVFGVDVRRRTLLILLPEAFRSADGYHVGGQGQILEAALEDFHELRAGRCGLLSLDPVALDADTDPLFAASRTWSSVTPYTVTRHAKKTDPRDVLVTDLKSECRTWGLPEPEVQVQSLQGVPGAGLRGVLQLTFRTAVPGPIVLGRDRHRGGGLFRGK